MLKRMLRKGRTRAEAESALRRRIDAALRDNLDGMLRDRVDGLVRERLEAMLQERVGAALQGQMHDLLRKTDRESRPNVNPLWIATKDIDVARLSLKHMGYALARALADGLPVRTGLRPERVSLACKPSTQADMESDWVAYWLAELQIPLVFHRKLWEYAYVLQALWERDVLAPGHRGLGFGCGEEPIPSLLAARGVDVTVTDLAPEASVGLNWQQTSQHTATPDVAFHPQLVGREAFDRHVCLEYVDMNAIPAHLRGYDFAWSICALEHLGSIAKGLDFVRNSLDVVRSGGVVVHTTEFNFSRDDETVDNWMTVLFQRRHFEALAERLRAEGHAVAPLDFDVGSRPMDRFVDLPPYPHDLSPQMQQYWGGSGFHLKLSIDGFPTTCFGLIVTKA